MTKKLLSLGMVIVAAAAATAIGAAQGGKTRNWPAYSGDNGSTKYSSLDQINTDTVGKLQIAWRQSGVPAELKALWPEGSAPTNWQNTPLMVDGLLYMSSGVGAVVALDAATGKVVWFDVPPHDEGKPPPRAGSTRGVAYWANGADSRIFATNGSNLIALNAKTGKRYSAWGTNGTIDLTKVGYDRGGITGYRNSSSPIVVRDVVVVAGVAAPATDYLNERQKATKEGPPGDIRGFDAKTGKLLWTFHVVPRPGEFGEDTWLNGSASYSGGSGVWSLLSADEDLGYVYLPLETATSDYFGGARPGNHLFAESLLCLDVKTGKRVWHFQTVHHGLWDYDLPAAPVLVDIRVNGRNVKAVAQVTKTAYTFVFDRVTGKPIWPIEERPVPKGEAPGEWYSPTQPVPTRPPAVRSAGRRRERSPRLHAGAESRVEEDHRRVQLRPALHAAGSGRHAEREEGHDLHARHERRRRLGRRGGRSGNRHSLRAVDAHAGHHRPCALGTPRVERAVGEARVAEDARATGAAGSVQAAVREADGDRSEQGRDCMGGCERRRPQESSRVQRAESSGDRYAGRNAAIVTKSLVFMGQGADSGVGVPAGFGGKMFHAFDKKTGKIVWQMELPAGVSNSPMTYMLNGKQYIVVAVSGRQFPGELVALALP